MIPPKRQDDDGDIMAGDRRISRPDSALPDWHIPDASYRPIPIAWFAAAFLLQMVTLFAIFIALLGYHGGITIALSALVTGAIGKWTWERGMKNASTGWKVATITMLAVQLMFIMLGASERF